MEFTSVLLLSLFCIPDAFRSGRNPDSQNSHLTLPFLLFAASFRCYVLTLKEGRSMKEQCLKCGAQLAPPFRFCPACGVVLPFESQEQASPAEIEKAPMQGAFSGLLFGAL